MKTARVSLTFSLSDQGQGQGTTSKCFSVNHNTNYVLLASINTVYYHTVMLRVT